ncbi:MAG: 50S ribosomal protein L23 [Gammaproteobacteria bacterium]|nr:50S ribosomal protein L23 [Gammaproteobacteria bacterium]OUU05950.1 MAG: 50S ribosomal protein L23 [Gammaproteobacteria bacterium TMED34]|tara:strand:+ start:274 stop:576 length:303 start_codon:yes stop_codon:yes gene_type:complete
MNEERLYQVLLGAHISEKATNVADAANQITFKVARDATRTEIKEAVQKLYDVEVRGVTVLNMKGKVKRRFTGASRKPNWKKAYVTLAEGQDIDFTSLSNG